MVAFRRNDFSSLTTSLEGIARSDLEATRSTAGRGGPAPAIIQNPVFRRVLFAGQRSIAHTPSDAGTVGSTVLVLFK